MREGGITAKWLLLSDEHYILMPQNTAEHQPIIISITEKDVIIGKVAWWWGKTKD